jgi:hypothetical protein
MIVSFYDYENGRFVEDNEILYLLNSNLLTDCAIRLGIIELKV